MKKITAVIMVLLIISGSAIAAESLQKQAADKKDVVQSKNELKQPRECLDRLTTLIDKWHEANLEGNEKDIRRFEQAIINTLIKDINASFHWVDKAEREHSRIHARVSDECDIAQARVLLAGKQALLYKWKKSDCFSLRYRALADYQDLLKRELKMTFVALADEAKDVRTDEK